PHLVRLDTPTNSWPLTSCSATGRSGAPSSAQCACTGGTTPPLATRSFQVTASLSSGPNDTGKAWAIRINDDGQNQNGKSATASPAGGLDANAYVFEIEDAVIATSNPTIDANCPSANKSATAGSTAVVVICGRNHITPAQ